MIEFKFDFKRFGCNEQVAKDCIAEMIRCVNDALTTLHTNARAAGPDENENITLANPEPDGVWVKPGMRVKLECGEYTVAPKGFCRHAREMEKRNNALSLYDDNGGDPGWQTIRYLGSGEYQITYNGKPVLGYEEDKP